MDLEEVERHHTTLRNLEHRLWDPNRKLVDHCCMDLEGARCRMRRNLDRNRGLHRTLHLFREEDVHRRDLESPRRRDKVGGSHCVVLEAGHRSHRKDVDSWLSL